MRETYIKISLIAILFLVFLTLPTIAFQQNPPPPAAQGGQTSGPASQDTSLTIPIGNPLGKLLDPRDIIGRVIGAVLGIIGSIALLMFILGGLTWMTAAGNPDRVKTGRNMLVWATLGLVVIFTSYVLVQFVLNAVTSGAGVGTEEKREF